MPTEQEWKARGFLPYTICQLESGPLVECISMPMSGDKIMIRTPGVPSTLREADLNTLTVCPQLSVRCTKHQEHYVGIVQAYPRPSKQTTHYCVEGDKFIQCPRCGLRYFWNGTIWEADRPLEVFNGEARVSAPSSHV